MRYVTALFAALFLIAAAPASACDEFPAGATFHVPAEENTRAAWRVVILLDDGSLPKNEIDRAVAMCVDSEVAVVVLDSRTTDLHADMSKTLEVLSADARLHRLEMLVAGAHTAGTQALIQANRYPRFLSGALAFAPEGDASLPLSWGGQRRSQSLYVVESGVSPDPNGRLIDAATHAWREAGMPFTIERAMMPARLDESFAEELERTSLGGRTRRRMLASVASGALTGGSAP